MINSQPSLTLANCTFFSNTAFTFGGGMYNESSFQISFRDCTFTRNTALISAGLHNENVSDLTMVNCHINDNAARFLGGDLSNSSSENVAVINSSITNNNAALYTGGIYNKSSKKILISGCLITGNRAKKEEGGMHNSGCQNLQIINSTITGNSAATQGGILNAGSSIFLRNSIVWGNHSSDGSAEIVNVGRNFSTDVQFNFIKGGYPGKGNIKDNPLFLASDSGLFYLGPGSPCIDAGQNLSVPPDGSDLDGDGNTMDPIPLDLLGHSRFVDIPVIVNSGEGSSPLVDMGAFEAAGGPVIFVDSGLASETEESVEIRVSLFWPTDASINLEYETKDGTAHEGDDYISSSGNLNWSESEEGTKIIPVNFLEDVDREENETIFLSINGEDKNAILINEGAALTILSQDIIYVNAHSSGANNGRNWENAFNDLKDALATANSGDEIWVAQGSYVPGSERTSTFKLLGSVPLYGGFSGNETSLEQRDLEKNSTILSECGLKSLLIYY